MTEESEIVADQSFRERLALLVKEHSLTGLARVLGIKYQNITRYLQSTQPPIAFGRALVTKLGVNPVWLLTGEGSPMLTDVPKQATNTASDLLELVQAMNAVSKMRLGALAGKQHLKVMRELNEAMVSYNTLRERLNRQSAESFRQIIAALRALNTGQLNLPKARHWIKAGEQISQLCDDPVLRRDFLRLVAHFHLVLGDPLATESHLREVIFANFCLNKGGIDAQTCKDVQVLVLALRQQFRILEAAQLAEAALKLTKPHVRKTAEFHALLEVAGLNDIETGKLQRGAFRLTRAYPLLSAEIQARATTPRLAAVYYFSGVMNYQAIKHYCGKWGRLWLGIFALWSEDQKQLHELYNAEETEESRPNYFLSFMRLYARYILSASRGGRSDLLAQFDAVMKGVSIPATFAQAPLCITAVIKTRIAIHVTDTKTAAEIFQQADKYLRSVAPEITLPIYFAAMHHRNALALTGATKTLDAARSRARKFFRKHIAAGYELFRTVPGLTDAPLARTTGIKIER